MRTEYKFEVLIALCVRDDDLRVVVGGYTQTCVSTAPLSMRQALGVVQAYVGSLPRRCGHEYVVVDLSPVGWSWARDDGARCEWREEVAA